MSRNRGREADVPAVSERPLPRTLLEQDVNAHPVGRVFDAGNARARDEREVTNPIPVTPDVAPQQETQKREAVDRERHELTPTECKTLEKLARASRSEHTVANKLAAQYVHPLAPSTKVLNYWRNWNEENPSPSRLKPKLRRAHADYERMFACAYERRATLEKALSSNRVADYVEERRDFGPKAEGVPAASYDRTLSNYYEVAHQRLLQEHPKLKPWSDAYIQTLQATAEGTRMKAVRDRLLAKDNELKRLTGQDARKAYIEAAVLGASLALGSDDSD